MGGIFELNNKLTVETVVAAKIHFETWKLGDISDVVDGIYLAVESKDQWIGWEVVVVNLPEVEIDDDSIMGGQVGEISSHWQEFVFDCCAT